MIFLGTNSLSPLSPRSLILGDTCTPKLAGGFWGVVPPGRQPLGGCTSLALCHQPWDDTAGLWQGTNRGGGDNKEGRGGRSPPGCL